MASSGTAPSDSRSTGCARVFAGSRVAGPGGAASVVVQRTGERHLEAALENNLADALETAGRREEAMTHLKAAAAGFADIGTATGDPEPGIWMLESW